MVRTTTLQACFLLFRTKVQKARRFACSSASILVVVWLAAWAILTGSGASALDGTAADVVASAFFKCGSASRTNPTTSHATTKLAVSSTKGATGHCFGAAGAVEAVFTTLAVVDRKAPPTINYTEPDPDCDLDYVPNEARDLPDLRVAVSNSFGFGGHNASIVVRAFDE